MIIDLALLNPGYPTLCVSNENGGGDLSADTPLLLLHTAAAAALARDVPSPSAALLLPGTLLAAGGGVADADGGNS